MAFASFEFDLLVSLLAMHTHAYACLHVPGKSTLPFVSSSAKTQPALQRSILKSYLMSPSRSSGARYLRRDGTGRDARRRRRRRRERAKAKQQGAGGTHTHARTIFHESQSNQVQLEKRVSTFLHRSRATALHGGRVEPLTHQEVTTRFVRSMRPARPSDGSRGFEMWRANPKSASFTSPLLEIKILAPCQQKRRANNTQGREKIDGKKNGSSR